jgi:hypothetical protein
LSPLPTQEFDRSNIGTKRKDGLFQGRDKEGRKRSLREDREQVAVSGKFCRGFLNGVMMHGSPNRGDPRFDERSGHSGLAAKKVWTEATSFAEYSEGMTASVSKSSDQEKNSDSSAEASE